MKKKDIISSDGEKILYFDKKLKLKSRELLAFLLKDVLTKGEISLNYSMEILTKELKFKDWEILVESIKEISSLTINFRNKSYFQEYEEFGSPVLESYRIKKESIDITFSKSFFEHFIFSKKFYSEGIHIFIFLWKEQFRHLYYYCKERVEDEKKVILSPEEIKIHLNIEGRYSRYNDFVGKIITPFLEEINKYILKKAKFEKIKIAPKKNLILLELKDIEEEQKREELNKLIQDYSNIVPSLRMFLKEVMNYLVLYDYNYVKEHLEYAIKKKELIFIEFVKALKANSCNIKIVEKVEGGEYLLNESKRFFTKVTYISWAFNLLLKSDRFDNFSSLSMEVLKLIHDNKTFSIEREGVIIEGSFIDRIGKLSMKRK